jgi:hypothetical protein
MGVCELLESAKDIQRLANLRARVASGAGCVLRHPDERAALPGRGALVSCARSEGLNSGCNFDLHDRTKPLRVNISEWRNNTTT